ncbi:MAG: polysaccharide deacetylase family protein [Candidatus Sericytochromatia bacterium]|nr:polysaccharide deacetylase family protein [Candidatus Tanganyikabacteria bacterium]
MESATPSPLRHVWRSGRRLARGLANRASAPIRLPLVVLAYHRVTRLAADPFRLAVAPERFRAHLALLRKQFAAVRFEADWSQVRRPAVVITFDDGYADNVREALPLLEEFGLPATFFVTSGMVGAAREFWWDELARLVLIRCSQPSRFPIPGTDLHWAAATPEDRQVLFHRLHRLCKRHGAEPILDLVRTWVGTAPGPRETHRALTLDELRRLAASPLVTVGAHTRTHPSLARLAPGAQRAEILGSQADLRAWLGRPIEVFSYPFGERADVSPETVRICAGAFAKAAVCRGGWVLPWTDRWQIPRMVVFDWDVAELAARLEDCGLQAA